MKNFIQSGRYFYAIAVIGFGVIQFVTNNFLTALLPLPATLPGRMLLMYFTSTLFATSGICIFIDRAAKTAAVILAVIFIIFLLYPNSSTLIANLNNAPDWTVVFENMALCSGALILTSLVTPGFSANNGWKTKTNLPFTTGKYLFAIALVVFGIQHFMYNDFISTLIPGWIPAHNVWLFFVKIAFIATAISIFINILVHLSTFLFGLMFLIWVLILHGPLVATHLHVEPQWTSFFIAVAMCGISFMLSYASSKKNSIK